MEIGLNEVKINGNVGIRTINPTEKLTVNGYNTNRTPCLGLRNGMSGGDSQTYGAQIALGHNGTNQYQHFISTRHYGGQEAGNRIDFYTCNGTQQNTITSGTNLVMSLDGTNVGIGTTSPTCPLDVATPSSVVDSTWYNTDSYSSMDSATTDNGFMFSLKKKSTNFTNGFWGLRWEQGNSNNHNVLLYMHNDSSTTTIQ